MAEEKIHPAVQLLIARFKSNPDEFVTTNRWYYILTAYQKHWSVEDKNAWDEAQREYHLEKMHEHIMEELLKDPEEERRKLEEVKLAQLQMKLQAHKLYAQQISAGGISSVSSQAWTGSGTSTSATPNTLQQIKYLLGL